MLEKTEEFNGDKVIEEFEALTKSTERVQRETLKEILEVNGKAEYLVNCGLNGRTDPESFKACVPIVTHSDLESYIQRIADGDSSPILTGKPITTISLSSGTTQGKPKFVPFNDDLIDSTMQIYRTSFAFRNREFPLKKNGKALQFIYSSKQFKTKGGLAAGTATTNVFRSSQYKKTMRSIQSACCSPEEVIFGPDFHQSLYCHFLCALICREDVHLISSTFAHSIVHSFRSFERLWESLCSDIRSGVPSHRHVTSPQVRSAVSKLLRPDPALADLIHQKCSALSNFYGVVPELFPNAKYIYGIMTGSMEPYLAKLRHYAGGVPLITSDYGSSEGWIGTNVNPSLPPELATYVVLPNIGYFEFVPLAQDCIGAETSPLGLTEVEVGQDYEILLTTYAGLYRYRLGDVVRVVGFHNSTPELKFVCRRNLILSINIDKNTEKDLQLAVEAAAAKHLAGEKVEVVDYTSHLDTAADPGHYVIFWELSGDVSGDTLADCCSCLDLSFASEAGYGSSRRVNSIGPLELRLLRPGTFQKVMDHYLSMGSTVSQFKTPRCVGLSNPAVLQILSANVVDTFFSTAF